MFYIKCGKKEEKENTTQTYLMDLHTKESLTTPVEEPEKDKENNFKDCNNDDSNPLTKPGGCGM